MQFIELTSNDRLTVSVRRDMIFSVSDVAHTQTRARLIGKCEVVFVNGSSMIVDQGRESIIAPIIGN